MTAVTADAGTGTVVNGPKDARDWYATDWDRPRGTYGGCGSVSSRHRRQGT